MIEVPASVQDISSGKCQRDAPKIHPSPGRHTEHSIVVNILLILCDGQICTHHKVTDITTRSKTFDTMKKVAIIFINPPDLCSIGASWNGGEIVDDDDEESEERDDEEGRGGNKRCNGDSSSKTVEQDEESEERDDEEGVRSGAMY
jgi:hypothetical protein